MTTARLGIAMELDALEARLREYISETHPSISDQLSLSLTLKQIGKDAPLLSFLSWMMEKENEGGTDNSKY